MFVVYMYAGCVKHDLQVFENEIDAIDFCDVHNWHWLDENRFEWALDVREV